MDLEQKIVDAIVQLGTDFPSIEKIVLFGSRARGDNQRTSDIDLAIWSSDTIHNFTYTLDQQAPTLLQFDCSHINALTDPIFYQQISKEGIVLYEKF